jgi:hypothetical protein
VFVQPLVEAAVTQSLCVECIFCVKFCCEREDIYEKKREKEDKGWCGPYMHVQNERPRGMDTLDPSGKIDNPFTAFLRSLALVQCNNHRNLFIFLCIKFLFGGGRIIQIGTRTHL